MSSGPSLKDVLKACLHTAADCRGSGVADRSLCQVSIRTAEAERRGGEECPRHQDAANRAAADQGGEVVVPILQRVAVRYARGCGGARTGGVAPGSGDAMMKLQQEVAAGTSETGLALRGQQVFLQGPCVLCHTIRGTPALSRVGPDLTHLSSRKTIAAGTLPSTRGNLAGWILNPQNLKPGSQMPPTLLSSADLHALVAYLESLP
jgi:cytochrome c1